jgi:hypothetical protein
VAFAEDVVKDAWELVEGKCECTRAAHQHTEIRCNKKLMWDHRNKVGWGAWDACAIDGNGAHTNLSNCEILCFDCKIRT